MMVFEKANLTEYEYELVAKGIAFGVGSGVLIGTLIGEVVLFFSLGGVIGIISTLAYTFYKRLKSFK
ncbi:hypothetical protein [Clostridium sardiniense]|uniref:hypothetical protein n=1 Tax=Clostridium sardiniense TaxID=29369 RepID=UPI001FD1C25D|nr:hypothetical protein [Clostridium sardiniense]MDQ0461712.1 hypothetical protein [Clostridium sardiniense]